MDSTVHLPAASPNAARARHSRMAIAALLFSFFAFLPPLGIVAIVLGHLSSRRIATSQGALNGKATARAATIIAYVQLALATLVLVFGWSLLGPILLDFRLDPWVQRVFREHDGKTTLAYSSARDEESTARTLITQLVAIQDEYHHSSGSGYLCNLGVLLQTGLHGTTPAEKSAFAERLHQSDYIFELHDCNSESVLPAVSYRLTAVPRSPRMPPGSMIFCADSSGTIKQINGGTSLDCYARGYVVVQPNHAPPEVSPTPPTTPPLQEPSGPCIPSERTPCGADMSLVHAAWSSPETLWSFLTSPSTGVRERRVAFSKADQIIPVEWMPRILAARREVSREGGAYNFGIAANPMSAYTPPSTLLKSPRDAVHGQINRMILAYPFVVPERWIPFPPSDDDLRRVWPAQVSEAMEGLYWNLIQRADADTLDSIALSLPCTDYQTALPIVEITTNVARRRHFAPPEVFGAWMNITRGNVNVNRASVGIVGIVGDLDYRRDDNWAMAQVLGLEALETNDSSITYPAIDSISNFRSVPYTFALAAARYLALPKDLVFNRIYEDDLLLSAIGEPPLGVPTSYDQKRTAEYEQLAVRFADWLRQNEASLHEKANLEKTRIEAARQKMSVATTCKP